MQYTYKNITKTLHLLTLVSPQRNSVSHVPLGAGATIELSYPGLDMYLPHILARLDEGGNDITHIVLRQKENAKTLTKVGSKTVTETKKAEAVTTNNPTAVNPNVKIVPAPDPAPVVPAPEAPKADTPAPVADPSPEAPKAETKAAAVTNPSDTPAPAVTTADEKAASKGK